MPAPICLSFNPQMPEGIRALTPEQPPGQVPLAVLIAKIQHECRLPLIATGGLSTPAQIAAVMHTGLDAVMVGTVLLRTNESGASSVHKSALVDPNRTDTVITRPFTGRPARALRNRFTERHSAIATECHRPHRPSCHASPQRPLRMAATAAPRSRTHESLGGKRLSQCDGPGRLRQPLPDLRIIYERGRCEGYRPIPQIN
jgi:NAD(P)H-dependent flavin oxidoreductase YrpB (nitropropane dioxygenase family)